MIVDGTTPTRGAAPSYPQAVRAPARQKRSQVTLQRILDAAGRTFDEIGVEATTMDAVARNAGTSIGSVYRFFADKQALIDTISQRWRDQAVDVFASLYTEESLASTPEYVVADFLTRFEHLMAQSPGTRGLLAASIAGFAAPDDTWTGYLERFLVRYAPHLTSARRRAAAHTYQIITFALMCATAQADSPKSRRLIDAKNVLIGYIHQLASQT